MNAVTESYLLVVKFVAITSCCHSFEYRLMTFLLTNFHTILFRGNSAYEMGNAT
jgi:hypothetical protein